MSTTTSSSVITTAARENVHLSPVDGLPGRLANSTIKWGGGLAAHPEVGEHNNDDPATAFPGPSPRPINPSLATLEKAVSARIYFENLYFPLLRQPPSREQRRVAMEKDMVIMCLSEDQKEVLRARWRQNETEYLRERRRKVDATAFIKLKTIGHGWSFYVPGRSILTECYRSGAFGVVSLVKERITGQLFAIKQVLVFHFNPPNYVHINYSFH